jgi:hypothetical protein
VTSNGGGPDFPIGEPTGSSWREHALAKITELEYLKQWVLLQPDRRAPGSAELAAAIDRHLAAAYSCVGPDSRGKVGVFTDAWSGAAVERTLSNLDAARTGLLHLAPLWYVRGQLPSLLAFVRGHLPRDDARRCRVEEIFARAGDGKFTIDDREEIVGVLRGAAAEARDEVTRVRSFRNILLVMTALLTATAAAIALLGHFEPALVDLCFNPDEAIVCPTAQRSIVMSPSPEQLAAAVAATASRWDIFVVELVGLIGAAFAAAAALPRIKGTSTPYSLPVAAALLKLPTGALSALLGILLVRGGFVPGLSALDTPGQIVAWALFFGIAQHLVTRLVDKQAQTVLDDVGGQGTGAAPAPP